MIVRSGVRCRSSLLFVALGFAILLWISAKQQLSSGGTSTSTPVHSRHRVESPPPTKKDPVKWPPPRTHPPTPPPRPPSPSPPPHPSEPLPPPPPTHHPLETPPEPMETPSPEPTDVPSASPEPSDTPTGEHDDSVPTPYRSLRSLFNDTSQCRRENCSGLPDPKAFGNFDDWHSRIDYATALVRVLNCTCDPVPDLDVLVLKGPPVKRYRRTAVVFLTYRPNRLKENMAYLVKNYAALQHHDIVVFHTGEFTPVLQKSMCATWPQLHFLFFDIEGTPFWTVPPFPTHSKFTLAKGALPSFTMGYRKMCRFHGRLLFYYLYQLGYEYMVRLDDDSRILTPIRYDLMEKMEDVGAVYGYRMVGREYAEAMVMMAEATHDFIVATGVAPSFLYWNCNPPSIDGVRTANIDTSGSKYAKGLNMLDYSDNFYSSRVDFWMRPDVQRFLFFLDMTAGFFYGRWGDQLAQALAVQIFASPRQLHWFDDWTYEHQNIIAGNFENPPELQALAQRADCRMYQLGQNRMVSCNAMHHI